MSMRTSRLRLIEYARPCQVLVSFVVSKLAKHLDTYDLGPALAGYDYTVVAARMLPDLDDGLALAALPMAEDVVGVRGCAGLGFIGLRARCVGRRVEATQEQPAREQRDRHFLGVEDGTRHRANGKARYSRKTAISASIKRRLLPPHAGTSVIDLTRNG